MNAGYFRSMKQAVLCLAVLLAACGDGKADAVRQLEEMNATEAAGANTVDLARFDLPLVVELPQGATPATSGDAATWDENAGLVRVEVGDRFGLIITEGPGDILRLKAAQERDMLRKYTTIEEAPDLLSYRYQFPDEDLAFVHFYRIIAVGGRTFVVESEPQGRFSEADVAVMAKAIRPVVPT